MRALIPGCAAFVCFVLFDINKIRWRRAVFSLCYPAGFALLGASLVLCAVERGAAVFRARLPFVLALLGMAASLAFLVYALFFALPAGKVYARAERQPLVASGLYGLCRHPAAWAFALFLLFYFLSFASALSFAAFVLYSSLNLLYVYVQDRWLFPAYLAGYESYRAQVPFLIPHRAALRRWLRRGE